MKGKNPRQDPEMLAELRQRCANLEADLKLYQSVFENAHDAIFIHDEQILEVNPAACEYLGYTREELLHMSPADINDPESMAQMPQVLETLQHQGYALTEAMHRKKDGTPVPVEISARSITYHGKPAVLSIVRNLSARQQAARAEESYKLALATTEDGFWDWNLQTDDVYFSDRYYTQLGYEPGAFPMEVSSWETLVHPDDLPRAKAAIEDYVNGVTDSFQVEFRARTKEGAWRWILGRGQIVVRDDAGNPLRFMGTHTDITELKEVGEALQTSERQSRTTIDALLDVLHVVDKEYRIILYNQAFMQQVEEWGFDIDEDFRGRNLFEMFPFLDEETRKQYDQVFETGQPLTTEDKTELEGQAVFTEARRIPVFEGDEVVRVITILRDITARKRTEEELRNFKSLVENAPSAIGIAGMDGAILYTNPAFREMAGYDDMSEMNFAQLYAPEDLPTVETLMQDVFSKGMWEGRLTWTLDDGSKVPVQTTVFAIHDDEGTPVASVAFFRDISEDLQAEQERERLQQEIIDAQQEALKELSTPIIPLMDRIIVMPLVGTMDSMRARDLMRALLQGISQHRAKIIILDVTGVAMMDTGIVNHLNKTIQAARLKGAQTIVTGISDAVAESIVDLGIDWGAVETLRDLQTGLRVALERMGIELRGA